MKQPAEVAHTFSPEAKTKAVLRVLRGESESEVAGDYGVSQSRLARWEREFVKAGAAGLAQARSPKRKLWRRLRKYGAVVLQGIGILLVLVLIVRVLTKFFEPSGD